MTTGFIIVVHPAPSPLAGEGAEEQALGLVTLSNS